MTVSKFLISTAAAAAVVGSIGLAYAQTSSPGSQTDQTTLPNQTQPSAQTEPSNTGTTPMNPSTDTSTMTMTERPAQADRN
jgi:hypothetical protein